MTCKDESLIPDGYYCHDNDGNVCPYWSMDSSKPEQANGHCSFIGKGDWDINKEANSVERKSYQKHGQDGWKEFIHPPGSLEGTCAYNVGLLFDKCKECNIKMDHLDEYFEEFLSEGNWSDELEDME